MKSNIWTYVGIYFEPISSGIKFSLDFYVWFQMLLISWCVLGHFSHVWLCVTLWTVARQAPLSMGFSRQEYWSGLPCPPPEGLPNPGIEPMSPMAPALQADSLPLSHWGNPSILVPHNKNNNNNLFWCLCKLSKYSPVFNISELKNISPRQPLAHRKQFDHLYQCIENRVTHIGSRAPSGSDRRLIKIENFKIVYV